MRASKLLSPKPIRKTQAFIKSRLRFSNFYCSKISKQDDGETVKEITSILHCDDRVLRKKLFQNLPQKLNPDVIELVLHRNQACDPKTLLHFFNWSAKQMGTSQNLKSFLILSMCFCNSNQFRKASGVLDQMIETHKPISDVVNAIESVRLSSIGFSQLIYAYKSKNMLNEAVSLLLSSKSADVFPNSKCLNSLMSDLLKNNNMDLFWKVNEKLAEVNVAPDVFRYSNVINAYCRSGEMEKAKRVFSEMEEKNCSPNLITYNLLIGGLCRYGLLNEALDYKKSMTEKGLIPDAYTYTVIIDGLCKAKRSSDAKLVLDDMNKAGLIPNIITYSSLINGFMREDKIKEALISNDEMVAKNYESQSTLKCINNLMRDLLKVNKMGYFWKVYRKMLVEKLKPDDYTYTNLIGGYARIGKLNEAKKLFYEMEKKGYKQMGTSQNLKPFLILSMWFCNLNQFRKASDVLDQMIETHKPISDVVNAIESVRLNSIGFSLLIYAYKSKNMLNEAVSLLLSSKSADVFPNSKCLNSLMSDLLKNNNMDLFWKVNEKLAEVNVAPDVFRYSNVINAYCRSGEMEEAKRVFSEMEEKNCSPNLITYNLLIGGLCRYGLLNEALDYKKSMTEKGLIPDAYTYTVIIDGLCKAKRSSDAKLVLDDMNKAGLIPNIITYSSLINGFMREEKIKEALISNDEMVAKNYESQSTLKCINNLMRDLLKVNKMGYFWKVYRKMLVEKLKPDDYTYTNLIGGYARIGKLNEAKKLFYEMEKKGYNSNLIIHNVLINGLCKTGLIDEAFELKRSMEKKGLRPDIYTYTNLIDGLCKLKRSHDAKLLLEDMTYAGLSPDNITYNALIDGFLKQGEVDEAFKLKNEMVAKGIEINLVTFNCLIDGLSKLGQCDKAIKIFEQMKEDARVLPDVYCYNSLINGLCKAKRLKEARVFLDEMVENGVKPNAFTYGALILAYNNLAEVKVANAYFNEMIGHGIMPDQAVLASVIDGHFKIGNANEALTILNNILGKSIIPDLQIYNAFIQGFSKNEMMDLAMQIYSVVKEKGLNLDVFAYSSLITGFIKQGDIENAFQLFDEMQCRNVHPNIVTYNTLINGLCKMGDVKRARDLFDEITEKGLTANASTYAAIIGSYCKLKNLPEAFKLLDEMPMNGIQADEFVYRPLVNGCCEEADTERAFLVFDRMVESGFASTPTFNNLVNELCKLGKLNEVNAAVKDNMVMNHATLSTLIHHHCELERVKEAENLLIEMKLKKLTPKIEAYKPILRSYIKSGEKSKLFTIFEDLISSGSSKNEASEVLLEILSEENNVKKSFDFLYEMLVNDLCCGNIFDRLLDMFCKKGKFSEALSAIDELSKRGLTLGFDTCKTLIGGLKSGGYDDDDVVEVFEKMVKFGWVSDSMTVNELISQEETEVKEVNMSNEAAL